MFCEWCGDWIESGNFCSEECENNYEDAGTLENLIASGLYDPDEIYYLEVVL